MEFGFWHLVFSYYNFFMRQKFLIANWKSNKTSQEIKNWFEEINNYLKNTSIPKHLNIIIAPSFPYLSLCKELINELKLPFKLASQDVSPFAEGSFTGEVNAKQIKEFADFVIIGHSERRKYFNENIKILSKKITQAKSKGLQPIYCTTEKDENLQNVKIVAFEPDFAIGTGKNAPLSLVVEKKREFFLAYSQYFLYGGSVNSNKIEEYIKSEEIDGFLVGTASLDPKEFYHLIQGFLNN